MKILVANVGSTSYKCRLIDMENEAELAKGAVERVGSERAVVSFSVAGAEPRPDSVERIADHREAVARVLALMAESGIVSSLDEVAGVGFKTVQAGTRNGSVLLTPEVTDAMEEYATVFPAHNPQYLSCIYYFREIAPKIPLVGVFEPGFHLSIPEHRRIFGLPYEWYEKYGVRKYGFHGASFRYVSAEVPKRLNLDPKTVKMIICHLGGSSSICAFRDGVSVDTSFSFTTQSGLVQSFRFGDVDPYAFLYVMRKKGIGFEEALAEAASDGGLLGISGVSADMRDLREAAAAGNQRAALAIDKFVYDIVRYIGQYWVLLEGADVIAFSGGTGMYDWELRAAVAEKLAFLGIRLDPERNRERAEGIKSAPGSSVTIVTVNTNEEIVVARETARVVAGS